MNKPPIVEAHEVRLFRVEEKDEAARFWSAPRDGKPLALFMYAEAAMNNHGHLYVAFPVGWGLTEKGHQAVIAAGRVSAFRQGIEIFVWISDAQIEKVISIIFDNLGELPGIGPAPVAA